MESIGDMQTGGGDDALSLDLVGSYRNTLDAKRRVAIPKGFRDEVEAAGTRKGQWVLCRQMGGDPCLALFPPGRYEAKMRELEQMRKGAAGVGTKTVRAYLRKLRMSAKRLVPDKQNRISLTEGQCQLAGISRDVAFVGSGDHIELWTPERLETADENLDFGELAGELFGDY